MANKHLRGFIDKYFESLGYFYRKLRYRVVFRMLLSILIGILDGLGLAMFIPLLAFAGGVQEQTGNEDLGKLQYLVDALGYFNIEFTIYTVLIIMIVFFSLKGIVKYLSEIYNIVVRQYFIRELRVQLSKDLAKMAYKKFVQSDSGRIQNTLSGETNRVLQAYESYFFSFEQIILTLVYLGFAFTVDARFAVIICIAGILSQLVFKGIYKKTKVSSKEVTSGSNLYQGLILQFVGNFKYLKATGLFKKYNQKLIDTIDFIQGYNYKVGKLGALAGSIREPILIIVVCGVILVQIKVFGGGLGTILMSLLFFYRALTSLMLMQTWYNKFLSVSGSMENMKSFERELSNSVERNGKCKLEKFKEKIVLDNVAFSYSTKKVIDNLSLNISRNRTYAFVGESGSGKTTLINMVCGLLLPESGFLKIDDINIKDIDRESFQRRIGYITQEAVIFGDTVFNNVTFWDEKNEENICKFNDALKKASIYDFVYENMTDGMDSELGSNGVTLSGGQKQRISIARELYKDVDILVLDEATSALDSKTENEIQMNIDALKGQYTILMIAHRLATIKNADEIILMEDSKIIGKGDFAELKINSDKFRRMVEFQEL